MKVRITRATVDNWYKVGEEYDICENTLHREGSDYHPLVSNRKIGIGPGHFEIVEENILGPQVYVPDPEEEKLVRNKYMREIKPSVWVDVYDVLRAWEVTDPCLQHLLKKALQPGKRHHKDLGEDLKDILASAKRAVEMFEEWKE